MCIGNALRTVSHAISVKFKSLCIGHAFRSLCKQYLQPQ
jgi:hypothetical protein